MTFSEGGNYSVNGEAVTVESGESITINRDGMYKFDGDGVISEKTSAQDIQGELIEQDSSIAAGNDSIVVRKEASATIDVSQGEPLIIPTSGKVTLENYHDNASVQTPAYNDLTGAIKTNEITFGDGVMTLGDAVVSFSPANESSTGSVLVDLINAQGSVQGVGFTNTNGGTIDASNATSDYVIKGNYADAEGDTLKTGGSRLLTGSGNDTLLAGGMDSIDAGAGYNVIYLTDETLRGNGVEGATLMISEGGKNTVRNFTGGYTTAADKVYVQDLSELDFSYGAGRLIISTEQGELTIPDLDDEGGYKLQITDGLDTYNAQVAVTSEELTIGADSTANYFYGKAINFSEYNGALEVNLNENSGYMDGDLAQFHGLSKVTGGSGRTTLIGGSGEETLIAGSGEASIWSNGGNDVMQGSPSADKSSATFYYTAGDGRDTITNFDFANSLADMTSDYVKLADNDGITDVYLSGNNVVIQINNSAQDYLTLMNGKGQSFHLNDDLIAKVDDNVEFDGFSNMYVGVGNSTLTVGEGFGDVEIWLSDDSPEYHGTWYEGTFRVLDASSAEGNDILAGNQLDNLIIGGSGKNSIWGGYGDSDDTLAGGSGQNTFYYELGNGNDVISFAHDGDIIRLEDVYLDNILSANITSNGVSVDFTDGGSLKVKSNAAIEYQLADGTSYTADHNRKEWQD